MRTELQHLNRGGGTGRHAAFGLNSLGNLGEGDVFPFFDQIKDEVRMGIQLGSLAI